MKTYYYQLTYDYQNDCDPTLKIKKLDNNNLEREYYLFVQKINYSKLAGEIWISGQNNIVSAACSKSFL